MAWAAQAAHQLSPVAELTRTLQAAGWGQGAPPQVHSPRLEAVPALWWSAAHARFSWSSMGAIEAEAPAAGQCIQKKTVSSVRPACFVRSHSRASTRIGSSSTSAVSRTSGSRRSSTAS